MAPRFLGWRMVWVAFCVDFVAVGFFFYSYGVFFTAIEQEFGGSRLGVSLGLTVTATVGAIAAPFVGHALDRFPLKRVIAAGATSMALGFLALSQVRTPLEFYLALGAFIGFGASAMGGLATAKLVTNWFSRRRGTALGIAATGISASGVVMPFITASLIESFGWREGFLLYGAFTALVVVPLVLRLVISSPEEVGLRPDGQAPNLTPAPAAQVGRPDPTTKRPGSILNDRNFWVLVAVTGLLFCCQSATLTHMVPRVTDSGVSLQMASLIMSLCAGSGIIGKLSFGWLVDRWTARRAIWFTIGCQLIGQIFMLQAQGLPLFALGAALFGYGMGGVVPMQGALVAKFFGRARFGKALGMMRPAMFPVQIVGVPLAGGIYDATGSYRLAFLVFIGLYLLAAVLALGFQERAAAVD
jgi:MFS family permease